LVVEVAVPRFSTTGGIARSLSIPGRGFYTFVDETVIIIAGSEVLFSILCILVNGKHNGVLGYVELAIGLVPGRHERLVGGLLSGPVGGLPLVV
jgi:hypothetical protein